MRAFTGRPSPALIISLVALVAALTGSAFALPGKNSIDKNDIKKNAVKSKQIKNGQVKKKDLAANSVNSAKIADGSVGPADLAKAEVTHIVGQPGEPQFLNGGGNDCIWASFDAILPAELQGAFEPAGFYKDNAGRVHLSGAAVASDGPDGDLHCGGGNDPGNDSSVFILPPEYRPAKTQYFYGDPTLGISALVTATDLAGPNGVVAAGTVAVNLEFASNPTIAGLGGISFRAADPATAKANAKKPPLELPAKAAKALGL